MLLGLLLVLNVIVCLALIGVVLLQRSEGGALGGGGGPTGLVTTRGAGDLLTRATWVLFALFLGLSLTLTLLGGHERSSQSIINRLKLQSVNPDAKPPVAPGSPSEAAPPPVQGAAPADLAAPKPSVRVPLPESAAPEAPGSLAAPPVSLQPVRPEPKSPKS